jgi:sugar phosphate isomerase/epimerase
MDRLSINEVTTYRWSFEDDVVNYRAAGIPAIGVWRQKVADFGDEKAIELLAESGLKVCSLSWASGFTGSEGRSFRDAIADAAEAIRLAGALSAPALVVYSGARNGHTQKHARRLFANALIQLLPLAEEMNVALMVEPMHAVCAGDCTYLTSITDTCELLATIGSPLVKMVFDTYHFGHGADALDQLRQCADRIGLVHLADAAGPPVAEQNRLPLGEGVLPLCDLVATLNECGYQGYYDVELFGEAIEGLDYHKLLTDTRQAARPLFAPTSLTV